MRYKIQKESIVQDNKVVDLYYVLYEKKVWWRKEPVWRYCREHTYATYDSWRGEAVRRYNLKSAEDYIKSEMLKRDLEEVGPIDIKIYECRDQKIDKILKK